MKGWSHAKWWSKRMIMVEDDDQKGDQVLNLEMKKEKNKNPMKIKAKVLLRVLVLVTKTL